MKIRFPLWLLALIGIGLVIQTLVLQQAWTSNPFARTPLGDAEVYWNWAGLIADGQLQGDTPFLSAPLYPYFLGMLRWFGASLLGVYGVQVLLHLATVALIADIGRRRFGAATGIIAAAFYLLLLDPSFYVGRIVNISLQLLTITLLLWQAVRILEQRTIRKQAFFGVLLGLSVLANPAMMLAVPIFLAWMTWAGGERDLAGGLLVLVLTVGMIAPATIHNHRACGEFIPVSSQAGLTFYHGNAPGATGTYHPVPGVAANRGQQNLDAYYLAADATGEESWRGASRYFFGEGISYLVENPGEAIKLESKKFWWFLTGQSYADLYLPVLESRQDFGSKLGLLPLSISLLIPLAFLGIFLLGRTGLRNSLPEILLFCMPLLVILVFWFSPRYRMPITPIVVILAARALMVGFGRAAKGESTALPIRVATGVLLFIGLSTGPLNRANGFDDPAQMEPAFLFSVGDTLRVEDRLDDAEPFLLKAIDQGFDTFESRYALSQLLLRRAGQLWASPDSEQQAQGLLMYNRTVPELKAALAHRPDHSEARENMANLVFWYWTNEGATRADVLAEINGALKVTEQNADIGATARLKEKLQKVLDTPEKEPPSSESDQ